MSKITNPSKSKNFSYFFKKISLIQQDCPFKSLIDTWLDFCWADGLSPKTLHDYSDAVVPFAHRLNIPAPKRHIPIKLLAFILKLGFARLLKLEAESLNFITGLDFDVSEADKVGAAMGISKPEINHAIDLCVDYLVSHQTLTELIPAGQTR